MELIISIFNVKIMKLMCINYSLRSVLRVGVAMQAGPTRLGPSALGPPMLKMRIGKSDPPLVSYGL